MQDLKMSGPAGSKPSVQPVELLLFKNIATKKKRFQFKKPIKLAEPFKRWLRGIYFLPNSSNQMEFDVFNLHFLFNIVGPLYAKNSLIYSC